MINDSLRVFFPSSLARLSMAVMQQSFSVVAVLNSKKKRSNLILTKKNHTSISRFFILEKSKVNEFVNSETSAIHVWNHALQKSDSNCFSDQNPFTCAVCMVMIMVIKAIIVVELQFCKWVFFYVDIYADWIDWMVWNRCVHKSISFSLYFSISKWVDICLCMTSCFTNVPLCCMSLKMF